MSFDGYGRSKQWPLGRRTFDENDGKGIDVAGLILNNPAYFNDFTSSKDAKPMQMAAEAVLHSLKKTQGVSLYRALPVLLRLKGEPYSIKDFFPVEPLFRAKIPQRITLMGSRQISKSTSLMALAVILGLTIPYFNILTVAPYFEMTRRLSQMFCKPFIEDSPFAKLFEVGGVTQNVLHRSLPNGSNLHFSYAFTDATRTRGIPADADIFDEVQSALSATLELVVKTMGASPHKFELYAGTPLTTDGPLEDCWQRSSQAEWVIKCRTGGCNTWNIPALNEHLLKMIDDKRFDVSEKEPGVVCHKCRKPIFPRTGHYEHKYPGQRWEHAGYHMPQFLFPMHYGDPQAWRRFVESYRGADGTAFYSFLNECCGVSYDSGTKLLSLSDLRDACILPWENQLDDALKGAGRYAIKVMAIDWGGGGVHRGRSSFEHTSYTAVAVLGLTYDHKVDVLYGRRLQTPLEPYLEAKLLNGIYRAFGCTKVVHDARGHGRLGGEILAQHHINRDDFVHVMYCGEMAEMMTMNPPNHADPRTTFSIDQYFAVTMACELIRARVIKFFKYRPARDWDGVDTPAGVLEDWTRLMEDKKEVPGRRDSHRIRRDPSGPDDFAHACVIGTWILYYLSGRMPDLYEYRQKEHAMHVKAAEERHLEEVNRREAEMKAEYEKTSRKETKSKK